MCELCSEPIATEHRHLVDLRSRTLLCACRGCFLLFESQGAGGDHFRSVPERYVAFGDFELTPAQWDSLQIPVQRGVLLPQLVARNASPPSTPGRRARPSPSFRSTRGPIWSAANPQLATMQPDVEAFLVRAGQ